MGLLTFALAASLCSEPAPLKAVPFALSAVNIAQGSRLQAQMDANTNWLLGLNESRLTCLFTSAVRFTHCALVHREPVTPFS